MADTTSCPKCGRPHDASRATCPYCGHTQWGSILPGLIFGLVCIWLFISVAPGITGALLRGIVKWGSGILGGLALIGSLMMISQALFHKNKPFPETPPPSAPGEAAAPAPAAGTADASSLAEGASLPPVVTQAAGQTARQAQPRAAAPPAPKGEPWKRPVQQGRIEMVRVVPLLEGRPHRYGFKNLFVKGKEIGKFDNPRSGFFSSPTIRFELDANKVMARTEKGDVFVNGEPLVGPRQLVDGDRITLGKDQRKADYEFQIQPQKAKARRREEECAQGLVRAAPDFSGEEKPVRKLNEQLKVSEEQLYFPKYQGGKQVHWKKLDEVRFIVDTGIVEAGGPFAAATSGAQQGIDVASSAFSSEQASDREAVFPSAAYTVLFRWRGEVVGKLDRVDRTACILLDQAVECYAPMDLVRFDIN
jgi:hypothetical protein